MKTENEILTDVYNVVKTTPINDLNGEIYKKTRLTDSNKEDCVISLISGLNAKFFRNGGLIVKIFYNDILINNTYREDDLNGQAKEELLINLSESLIDLNGYSFTMESRETYTEKFQEDSVNQHYAVLRINFKIVH